MVEAALAHRFVNQDTGCYRDIQRFDGSLHGNLNPFVAKGQVLVGHPRVFSSHDDTGRVGVGATGVVVVAVFGGCYYLESAVLQELDGLFDIGFAADGNLVEGTGGGLDGIRCGIGRFGGFFPEKEMREAWLINRFTTVEAVDRPCITAARSRCTTGLVEITGLRVMARMVPTGPMVTTATWPTEGKTERRAVRSSERLPPRACCASSPSAGFPFSSSCSLA